MLNQTSYQPYCSHALRDTFSSGEVLHTDYLQVYYDAATTVLHVKWQGAIKTKEFREGYKEIQRIVSIHKPNKWVLDLQDRESIRKADQLWAFKNVYPQILRLLNSDVFIAVILPVNLYESEINDIDGDDFIDNGNLLIMQHFLYYEESLRWLQEVEVKCESA